MSRTTRSNTQRLAQAAAWRLLGLLLERPRAGWHAEVAALAQEVADPDLRAVVQAAQTATEGAYLRCVGPGGVASPRAVAYAGFQDPGRLLAEVAEFYKAFGFRPRSEDPVDHVGVEVGFVSFLLLKEAFALADGNTAAARITAGARQRFVEDHLATLAHPFAERLELAGPSYLLEVARLLAVRVPAPAHPTLMPNEDLPAGCGACPGD
jgi:TorA maturation chaperone TorD